MNRMDLEITLQELTTRVNELEDEAQEIRRIIKKLENSYCDCRLTGLEEEL